MLVLDVILLIIILFILGNDFNSVILLNIRNIHLIGTDLARNMGTLFFFLALDKLYNILNTNLFIFSEVYFTQ